MIPSYLPQWVVLHVRVSVYRFMMSVPSSSATTRLILGTGANLINQFKGLSELVGKVPDLT